MTRANLVAPPTLAQDLQGYCGHDGRFGMTHVQAIATARALLRAGFTRREIAELLGAHPRAIEALMA